MNYKAVIEIFREAWKQANTTNYNQEEIEAKAVSQLCELIVKELEKVQRVGADEPHGGSRYDLTEIYLRERIKELNSLLEGKG